MQTARTYLAPIAEADFADFLQMFQEPDTFAYIPKLQNRSEDEYREFLQSRLQLVQSGQGYYWSIRALENDAFIGALNLYPYNTPEVIHLGCQIRRQFWHQGYASEVMEKGRDFGVNDWGLPQVYAFVDTRHRVSIRLLDKLGFERITVRQEAENGETAVYRYLATRSS